MRLVIATCAAHYSGRLSAHLPLARRLIVHKADGSVLLHSEGGSYKPLNWMSPPCTVRILPPDAQALARGVTQVWQVAAAKSDDILTIEIWEVLADIDHDLGVDPGLVKDGVEAHLQALLAEHLDVLGPGHTLVRREYPTPIGPVDLVARGPHGEVVVVEVKRRGEIDGVEQLTRYLHLLRREAGFENAQGVLAAQEIKPQARTLAADRGIACVLLDYDGLRGLDDSAGKLF